MRCLAHTSSGSGALDGLVGMHLPLDAKLTILGTSGPSQIKTLPRTHYSGPSHRTRRNISFHKRINFVIPKGQLDELLPLPAASGQSKTHPAGQSNCTCQCRLFVRLLSLLLDRETKQSDTMAKRTELSPSRTHRMTLLNFPSTVAVPNVIIYIPTSHCDCR